MTGRNLEIVMSAWVRALSLAILVAGCRQLLGLDSPVVRPDGAGIDADPNAPVCTIVAPATGVQIAYDETVRLEAMAIDPQDGALPEEQITWHSDLEPAPLGTGTALITQLPVGSNTVSCVVTDSTNLSGVAIITVVSQSPVPRITHPSDGETRPTNQSIPFNGNGRDLEDGTLPPSALMWTSDKDGTLGTGTAVSATLSAGAHVVKLSATDSDGNTYAASITLTIQ